MTAPTVGMQLTVVDARGVKGPGVVTQVGLDSTLYVQVGFDHETEGSLAAKRGANRAGATWWFGTDGDSQIGLTLIFKPFEEEGEETFDGPVDGDTPLEAAARELGWMVGGLIDQLPWEKRGQVQGAWMRLGAALRQPSANQGELETLRDRAEGLEADLRMAVQVAYQRGATEWARLNYPQWIDWLEACEAAAPTTEGGR